MKNKTIRILQIVASMNMGGIENFLMNIYRNIDKKKIQFDFLVSDEGKNYFEDEILNLGGKIFKIPSIKKGGHLKHFKELKKILKTENYQIIHSHYNAISGLILKNAKKVGVKTRIAHSHTAPGKDFKYRGISGLYKSYSKSLINKNATHRFACSELAGKWLYGENSEFKVIKNGIVAKNYIYNEKKRITIREKLELKNNEIGLGHIGRFDEQKNHKFLIEVFKSLNNLKSNYKLFLIGDGKLRKEMEDKVKDMKLEDKVIFLGLRKDIPDLLQAFDLFVFPSLMEGLPVTLIEAQASGLKCFISDSITKEVDLGCNLLNFISLQKTSEEWANIINENSIYERENTLKFVQSNGYDMTINIKEIEKMYLGMI